jgi:hypothetical protein
MKTMFIGVIIVGIAIMIVLFAFNFINSMEIQPTSQDDYSKPLPDTMQCPRC